MALTAFATATETVLANSAADLVALGGTFDDAAANNENGQLLVVLWQVVKAIKARQHAAPTSHTGTARDRVFELVGGHSANAFMALINQIDEVYNEFYALFNSNDQNLTNDDDEIWGTNLFTNGTGPQGGPIMGSPNYTPGLSA